MMMFFFSDDRNFDRHVFALGRARAAELFLVHQVLNNVPAGDFWCERVTVTSIVEPDRSHLQRALELQIEGIGTYDQVRGWSIVLPHQEATELA